MQNHTHNSLDLQKVRTGRVSVSELMGNSCEGKMDVPGPLIEKRLFGQKPRIDAPVFRPKQVSVSAFRALEFHIFQPSLFNFRENRDFYGYIVFLM